MEAEARPFPRDETTPPVIKINLLLTNVHPGRTVFIWGKIPGNKVRSFSAPLTHGSGYMFLNFQEN
jgi:hypothetical protein